MLAKGFSLLRLSLAMVSAASMLAAIPARAENAAGAKCDLLAAVPFDSDKPSGVQAVDAIAAADIAEAVRSCEIAANAPGAPRRMWLQYGRALEFAERGGDAIAAYEKAAGQGSAMAMLALSDIYNLGRGVPKDDAKALALLRKAAETGNPPAMHNLASMYGLGEGTAKSIAEAKRWYVKAAEAGFAEAMYELGGIALGRDGEPEDVAGAKAWFEKAAAQDHPGALYKLGLMAARGKGGPKDEALARRYLARAASLGDEDAPKALHKLDCPFTLKKKDSNQTGEVCFDGPVIEFRNTGPR